MIYLALALFLAGVAILAYLYGFHAAGAMGGPDPGAQSPGGPDPDPRLLALRWSAQYESGHPLIDAQHRLLFEVTNELLGVAAGTGSASIETAYRIHLLLDHAARHFEVEAELLRAAGYPRLNLHVKKHKELLRSATRLESDAEAGRLDCYRLFSFLSQELVLGHMLIDDRDFAGLFRKAPAAAVPGPAQPDPLSPAAARTAATSSSAGPPLER